MAASTENCTNWLTMISQTNVRNMCILAHVDHGKTTCADNLVATNGVISRQSAGKIRYMDSRVDEQERQITMKSSSIALQWTSPNDVAKDQYLINLIDSPGHVDFTSEVSTAARLADGALVVVDVVEGIAAQTRTVLRQAWRDRVRTCLLLNKVDRLVVELELTPLEAYERLLKIVEQVNAVNQQLLSEEIMAKDAGVNLTPGDEASALEPASGEGIDLTTACLEFDAAAEEACTYSPERGNVAFGSASHGWAFRLDTFAKLVAGKLGAKPENLQRVLWGEWSFNKKTKRAQRRCPGDSKAKPMFVEFILQQVFAIYDVSYRCLNTEVLAKMQAQIPAWAGVDLTRLSMGASAVRELLSRWLPFADCVLQMAVEKLPSPPEAAANRLPVLCPRWFAAGERMERGPISDSLITSDPTGNTVAYVAKFLAADIEHSVLTGDRLRGDEDVQFVGICRVFAGTLRPSQSLYIMREEESARPLRMLNIKRMYLLKGRFLEPVLEAPAGSIIAAEVDVDPESGESGKVQELGVERYLTLCDSTEGPFMETPYSSQAFAIVRVSIEPKHVGDLDALDKGLRLLHKADPSVSVEAMVTGENVLGCCGDEHLKRCITDLQNLYARDVQLSISKPLVAVRESIASSIPVERIDPKSSPLWLPSWATHLVDTSTEASSVLSAPISDHDDCGGSIAPEGERKLQDRFSMSSAGVMTAWTANRKFCFRIRAAALPLEAMEWMDEFAEELEAVVHRQRASVAFASGRESVTHSECLNDIAGHLGQRMRSAGVSFAGAELCGMSVAKGSRTLLLDSSGSAIALNETFGSSSPSSGPGDSYCGGGKVPDGEASDCVPKSLWPSLLAGFHLASAAGPLCEEPMRGVAFVILGCHRVVDNAAAFDEIEASAETPPVVGAAVAEVAAAVVAGASGLAAARALAMATAAGPYGPMSGQVMVAMKEACRCSVFRRGFARICEAMLSLEVQCEQVVLGKVYAVLGRRRAKVLDEGLRDGTSQFYIRSYLPLADSFLIAQDLRQAASGCVACHCAFSHWEQSDEDPFQEATLTPDELEELGDQPLPPNQARRLIDAIRKRKGLATDEKVVKDATKQRTVTRMK